MQQSKELPWSVTIKRTARENHNTKYDEGASQSKWTAGSITIESQNQNCLLVKRQNDNTSPGVVLPETTKFEMTASEYHSKKNCQRMSARECHFQKDCMGVSQLKGMAGSITTWSTTIKRSTKELRNYCQGVSKSNTKILSRRFSDKWIFRPIKILARTNSALKTRPQI